MPDPSPGVPAPAYVFIPVQRAAVPGEPVVLHGRHRRAVRQRAQWIEGSWTVIPPSSSLLRCVARRLRATVWA